MTHTVTFEKIVGGGKALGYIDGKPCFAPGPLPGEIAEIEIIKDKPGFVEASVINFETSSVRRNGAAEAHYLSCSPWQNVDYEYQLELKTAVLHDAFRRPGLGVAVTGMEAAPELLHYRNKLEFSLKSDADGLQLAFHARGSYEDLIALPEGCVLGPEAMNAAAISLAARAHELKLGGYIETLTVRQSQATGALLGHIALHQVPKRDWKVLMAPELSGIVVSRVRRRVDHELIWHSGETQLVETVGGVNLAYPYDGFFQTNVPMFETVLQEMLKSMPKDAKIIDLYGGVGTIGLAAAQFSREVIGVEINASSVKLANDNAQRNKLINYRTIQTPAQQIDLKLLEGTDCVVVDPPRAGLELRLVKQIIAAAPQRIIYLSCNPVTQARDIALLNEMYVPGSVTGYDLYPGTLHLESLIVLEKR